MNSIKHYQEKIQKLQETAKEIYKQMENVNFKLREIAAYFENFDGNKAEKAMAKKAAARCRLAIKYLKVEDFRGDVNA